MYQILDSLRKGDFPGIEFFSKARVNQSYLVLGGIRMLGLIPFLRCIDYPLRKRGTLSQRTKKGPQETRPDWFVFHGGLYVCRQGYEDTNHQVRRLRIPADKSYLALREGRMIISLRRLINFHVKIRIFKLIFVLTICNLFEWNFGSFSIKKYNY